MNKIFHYLSSIIGLVTVLIFNYFLLEFDFLSSLMFALVFAVGALLPDLDVQLKMHRSWITHSLLIPLVLLALKQINTAKFLSLGIIIHLILDIGPKDYKGSAIPNRPNIKKNSNIEMYIAAILSAVCLYLLITV